MKRTPTLLMLIATMAFTSCDTREMDYAPIEIQITATDTEGNDLFDPQFKDNVLDHNITFTYCGSTYEVDTTTARYYQTRAILAIRHQPMLFSGTDHYYIKIGEWAGDQKWNNEPIVINWPDGTQNTISFTLKRSGITHAKYYLDGHEHRGNTFSFIR